MGFVLLLLSIVPVNDGVLRDNCDLFELNHFYDEYGKLVFDQLIMWDFVSYRLPLPIGGVGCRYEIRDWRLVKHESQLPKRDHATKGYIATWMDGERLRQVWAKDYRETFTQYDVETSEREIMPVSARRKLKGE